MSSGSRNDDADPDDAGLEAFRAAWRSMPDEEPPQRGLADLLAAARVRADEMAAAAAPKHAWWEKLFAFARQQQVYALATIVIVVGGAVLIGRHHDEVQAPAPSSAERVSNAAAAGSAAPSLSPVTPPPQGDLITVPHEEAPGEAGGAAEPEPKAESKLEDKPVVKVPPRPRTKPTPAAATGGKVERRTEQSEDSDVRLEREESQLASEAAGPKAGMALDTSAAVEQRPTSAQLHAQARNAAAANDCATARRLMQQIQRSDAAYYKAKIANDTSLASCR